MKLAGKVVRLESGSQFADKIARAFIQIGDDTGMYGTFRFPNLNGYEIDDEVEVEVRMVGEIARSAS